MAYKKIKYKNTFTNNGTHTNVITGALLILLLSIFSNSLTSLLHKKTIHFFFKKNVYINYIILLFIIYFLIDFAYQNTKHPLYELYISIIIMITFIMYSKIHYTLNIAILLC